MKNLRDTLIGLLLALVAAIAVGLLAVRVEAIQTGLIIDWNNKISGITSVGAPWLQHLAIALVCGLVLYLFLHEAWVKNSWAAPMTAAAVLIVVAIWAHITANFTPGADEAEFFKLGSAARMEGNAFVTWLRFGGLNPAIHVTAAASLLLGVHSLRHRGDLSAKDRTEK